MFFSAGQVGPTGPNAGAERRINVEPELGTPHRLGDLNFRNVPLETYLIQVGQGAALPMGNVGNTQVFNRMTAIESNLNPNPFAQNGAFTRPPGAMNSNSVGSIQDNEELLLAWRQHDSHQLTYFDTQTAVNITPYFPAGDIHYPHIAKAIGGDEKQVDLDIPLIQFWGLPEELQDELLHFQRVQWENYKAQEPGAFDPRALRGRVHDQAKKITQETFQKVEAISFRPKLELLQQLLNAQQQKRLGAYIEVIQQPNFNQLQAANMLHLFGEVAPLPPPSPERIPPEEKEERKKLDLPPFQLTDMREQAGNLKLELPELRKGDDFTDPDLKDRATIGDAADPRTVVIGDPDMDGPQLAMASGVDIKPPSASAVNDSNDGDEAETVEPAQASGFEKETVTVESAHAVAAEQLQQVSERLYSVADKLDVEVQEGYLQEIYRIEGRLKFWQTAAEQRSNYPSAERAQFERDIVIGERLLLGRILRLGAAVFSEPIQDERIRDSLRSRGTQQKPARKEMSETGDKPEPQATSASPYPILPALINHDIGYGPDLMLRDHQIRALARVKGVFRMLAGLMNSSTAVSDDRLQGAVVMPVGGGKTRVMVASFAAAIEEGIFDAARHDKFVILNHTTDIHGQNLEVAQLLAEYFQKRFGRPLKVSEYKAENKDLSGDVVVVSIPTVNNETSRNIFKRDLSAALGTQGQVRVVAVDEVHHLELNRGKGKESWLELAQALRDISPSFYRLGFTATPTGREGTVIARVSEQELMQAGVTPRTYLVNVQGVDLSQLKVAANSGDFAQRDLVSTLLEHPERNTRVFQALEARGLRADTPSPSGKSRLRASLGFTADLQHAAMVADAYANYFARDARVAELNHRNLKVLGENEGKITLHELNQTLAAYRVGTIDGIVVVVSGQTRVRDEILQAVRAGEIEAAISVDVWNEGADLPMFTHQLGLRSTFSRYRKGQERGRVNRREKDDVSLAGELKNDQAKILFDAVDRYNSYDRALVRYADVMGVPGASRAPFGELFDAVHGEVVGEVDRKGRLNGQFKPVQDKPEDKPEPVRKPEVGSMDKVTTQLWQILETKYNNDTAEMALDLGIAEADLKDLLEGKGWIKTRWFLRRMATLLYETRDVLVNVYNEAQGQIDEKVTAEDMDLLRAGVAVYERWEGREPNGVTIAGTFGFGRETVTLFKDQYLRFQQGRLVDQQWRNIWRGLRIYFSTQLENPERAIEAQAWEDKFDRYFWQRQGWQLDIETATGLLLSVVRQRVAERYGALLPHIVSDLPIYRNNTDRLNTFIDHGEVSFERNRKDALFYTEGVCGLLCDVLGMDKDIVQQLAVHAIFEQHPGWNHPATTANDRLLLKIRTQLAIKYDGIIYRDFEGIPQQGKKSGIAIYVETGMVTFNNRLPQRNFFRDLRILLVQHLDVPEVEADQLLRDAIFETNNWQSTSADAAEKLLLKVRVGVAELFGGDLPINLAGLPNDNDSPLYRYVMDGKLLKWTKTNTRFIFYGNIKTLLTQHLRVSSVEADELIKNAVFEENKWEKTESTAQDRLLLKIRERVAVQFGGALPSADGTGQSQRIIMNKYLTDGAMPYTHMATPAVCYRHLRNLAQLLGIDGHEMAGLIQAAIFEERGWPTAAQSGPEVLLRVRQAVAEHFGGRLISSLEGLPMQTPGVILFDYVENGILKWNHITKIDDSYEQLYMLMTQHLGIPAEAAQALIQAARTQSE